MDWNKGYTATYYMSIVDPATWRDIGRVEIIDGSISRTDSALRHAADVTCRDYEPEREAWVRIYLDARQGASGAHEALFTGLATSPETAINGNVKEYPLQCFSVLKPVEDVYLPRGWYAPSGMAGATVIKQLLSVCPCPVEVTEESPTLSASIIAEDSETHLTMIDKVLKAIGWRLRIAGDGTVEISPAADAPVATFDILNNDAIEPQLTLAHDWYECPNCFRAIRNDMSAVAKDETDGPLSISARGREVWAQDTSSELANDESIAEYAVRRLAEEQARYIKISYNRRFNPGVAVSDNVRLHYPAQGVDGIYRVNKQDISLTYGATTSEEVSNGGHEEDG